MSTDLPQHTLAPSHAHRHAHEHDPKHVHGPSHRLPLQAPSRPKPRRSVLAWPAWLRVLAVLPVVVVLWLAVLWANEGAALW